jgi:hypothetical protein
MINIPDNHILQNLKLLKDILDKVFASDGYTLDNFNIKIGQPLSTSFAIEEDKIALKFLQNFPKISWKKFITISAWIQGIDLTSTGGTLKIKYFPDIKFSFGATKEENFASQPMIDLSPIKEELKTRFPDEERQKLASLCLQYAEEWATICHSQGMTRQDFKNPKLKKDCYNFVKESIDNETKHGSVILTIILLYVVLPVVLRWIIDRMFSQLTA